MQELTTWIYFFPVNIRARYLLLFLGLLSLFGTIVPFDRMAHGAHLGGIVLGIAYVHWFHTSNRFGQLLERIRQPRPSRPLVKVRFPKSSPRQRPDNTMTEELPSADFISKEVDPILEKISAHGIHSLTEKERKTLEAARAKMQKR